MKILAVDPGLATGVAMWDDAFVGSWIVPVEHAYPYLQDTVQWADLVVFETFTITAKTIKMTRQNDPLELIGVIKFLCWRYDIEWVPQSPTDAKSFVSNARLKQVGWYHTGAGHDNDAARHLLTYLARKQPEHFERLIRESS